MNQAVIMVEEPSIGHVVNIIAERLGIANRTKIIAHEGKGDLKRSFPRKVRAWNAGMTTRFVICMDNDTANCTVLKNELRALLPPNPSHEFKIRLVMNELEAWYLGDMDALELAGYIPKDSAVKNQKKKSFRVPENMVNAKREFLKLVKTQGQITLARSIAPHLNLQNDRCKSFKHFVEALQWAAQ